MTFRRLHSMKLTFKQLRAQNGAGIRGGNNHAKGKQRQNTVMFE